MSTACLYSVAINVRSWNVSAPGSWVVSAVFSGLATKRHCWARPGPAGKDHIPERVNWNVSLGMPVACFCPVWDGWPLVSEFSLPMLFGPHHSYRQMT